MSVLESLINEGNQIIMESDHALEIGYEPATEGFFRRCTKKSFKTYIIRD